MWSEREIFRSIEIGGRCAKRKVNAKKRESPHGKKDNQEGNKNKKKETTLGENRK